MQGASWSQIGAAVGMSKQAAYDWYERKISEQEKYVPTSHDALRARAVLEEDEPGGSDETGGRPEDGGKESTAGTTHHG